MDADFVALARDFALALFLGALVGIEREKRKQLEKAAAGGLRTFILLAEAGALAAYLARATASPLLFAASVAVAGAVILSGYLIEARRDPDALGLTTEVAGFIVFLLGATVLFGFRELAVALGIATSAVLAFKEPLHQGVERLGRDDILAGLKLLIATFIVLPLLPDRALDPWGALNPSRLWWLVILISSLSLVGYVAMRWLGPERGTVLTGLCGGLVSSTAVTLAFARRSRSEPEVATALAAGVLLAWSVMFLRVLVMVGVLAPALLAVLAAPLGAMFAATAASAGLALVGAIRGQPAAPAPSQAVPLRNPFRLTAACQFGLFFAVIQLAVKLAESYLPSSALYLVAAVAGTTDVDAITLSMAGAVGHGTAVPVAATAIVLAALANTLVKLGLAATLGAPGLRRRLAVTTLLVLAAAALALSLARSGARSVHGAGDTLQSGARREPPHTP